MAAESRLQFELDNDSHLAVERVAGAVCVRHVATGGLAREAYLFGAAAAVHAARMLADLDRFLEGGQATFRPELGTTRLVVSGAGAAACRISLGAPGREAVSFTFDRHRLAELLAYLAGGSSPAPAAAT